MKKLTMMLSLILLLSLSGCIKEAEKTQTTTSAIQTESIGMKVNATEEDRTIILHGNISSGITIPGNNIYVSGDLLIYNDIFTIKIPNKGLIQRDFYNTYGDTLNINDENLTNLQIIKYTLSQKNKCDYNFDEGVKSISKNSKIIDGITLRLANVLFYVTSPDSLPSNSRQSFLCFTKGENVYKITISDESKFRTDIISSFKFIK